MCPGAQEATQISESCHRIEKFHDSLRVAPSRREYEKAMAIVVRETMVIPVEWVFQQSSALIATKGRKPTLQQAIKDVGHCGHKDLALAFACV